jgi:tetratricopeptide (TPR) repeat protein
MAMQRPAHWPTLFGCAVLCARAALAADAVPASHSATVIGTLNPLLSQGSEALEKGRYEEGIRLSLAGLEEPASTHDQAAAHSNICAGYAALRRFAQALGHCNRALELDRGNWRTYNNRAAVFVGLKRFDLAMTDVNAGLEIAPDSATLLKSREVVREHDNAAKRERWRKPDKA